MLKEHTLPPARPSWCRTATCAPRDFNGKLGQANNPEWKTVAFDESGKVVLPNGAIGFRWGPDGRADQGQWNLEAKEARHGQRGEAQAVGARRRQRRAPRPRRSASRTSAASRRALPAQRAGGDVLVRTVPVQRIALGKAGEEREALVATVFDLQAAQLRRRARPGRRTRRQELRRRHAVHAGLAGEDHRRAARRRSSPWRASSPTTPTRRTASRW